LTSPATSVVPAVAAQRTAGPIALANGTELLEVLWNASGSAMLVLDADRVVRRMNPAAAAALAALEVKLGERIEAFAYRVRLIDPDQQGSPGHEPIELSPVETILGGAPLPRTLVEVQFTDAERGRRLLLTGHPLVLEDGSSGALLVWDDLTDGWSVAHQDRNEITRLGQLLEGAADYAIVMLDGCGRVRSWSPAAERLHGYLTEEAIGLPYSAFFDPVDRDAQIPQANLAQAQVRGKLVVEGKRVCQDGSVFWAHESISVMRDEEGRPQGYVRVTHDVSEQRALEQASQELTQLLEARVTERTVQLEQKNADLAAVNAELEAFSYSVSHDLRAPLRAMSGFARILVEDYSGQMPGEALQYLRKVTENAEHMGSLIDALLSFSRMQRQQLQAREIDMSALVRECWQALAPSRQGRSIEFVPGPLPPAYGDQRLIQQVWMNLLDNAIKYTARRENARVEVRAESADQDGARHSGNHGEGVPETVMYLVKDNGAGFDMRYAAKLGQVFQRLHHQEEFSGTGIGLALSQRIIHRHGGQLSAVGQPGLGATIGFTLQSAGGGRA